MSISKPTTRLELIEYCKHRLGYPVIESFEVTPEQYEIRVDEAVQKFHDYHMDSTESAYLAHQVTEQEAEDGYITLPADVVEVTQVLSTNAIFRGTSASGFITSNSPYFMFRTHRWAAQGFGSFDTPLIDLYLVKHEQAYIDEILNPAEPYSFNKHTKRLRLQWSLQPEHWVVYEAYTSILEDESAGWGDDWLVRYTTELFRLQWAMNLSKFQNVELPGGIIFNVSEHRDTAERNLQQLDEELLNRWSAWPGMIIG